MQLSYGNPLNAISRVRVVVVVIVVCHEVGSRGLTVFRQNAFWRFALM